MIKLLKFLFSSNIGQKILMSLTGLFLVLFLVVHLAGNFQLLKNDHGFAFNYYTWFMTTNPLIKFISYSLYAFILLHAFKGFYLVYMNRKARGSAGYKVKSGNANSHWTSRNMGILGSIILIFIFIHMNDFWFQYKFKDLPWTVYSKNMATDSIKSQDITKDVASGQFMEYFGAVGADAKHKPHILSYPDTRGNTIFVTKDLYQITYTAFKQWWLVLFYVLAMLMISFHLWHGFASAFQTLGLNHPRYTPFIKGFGKLFSILVPLGFAILPIIIYLSK